MRSGGRTAALTALFFAALALRPQIVGAAPLFARMQDDLHTSHAVIGLLGTIPVLCMGLFAPVAAQLAGRIGTGVAMTLALALIGVFGLLRAASPGVWLLVLLTFPMGMGMGLGNALAPLTVRERMADRAAAGTGVYTTGIQIGSTASAALAIPLAAAFGGWRAALAAFSVVACALVVVWIVLVRPAPNAMAARYRSAPLPWRSRTAWLLVAIFSLMGMSYYGLNAWLPDAYGERGWSDGAAGTLLAMMNVTAIPFSFLVPWFSERHGGRKPALIAMGVLFTVAAFGLVAVPGLAHLWALLAGVSQGGMFALVMTLPLDLEQRPERVGALVAMMLGVGYTVAAVGPFLLGAVRDVTGSFDAPLWLVVGLLGGLVTAVSLLPRRAPRPA